MRTWIRPGFLVVFPLLAIACVGAESTSTPMPVLTPTVTPGPTPTTTPNSTCNFDQLEIYVSDADGSNETRLTYNPAHDSYPSWSPDGSKIAFQSRRDGTQEIYVMDADGSNQTRLTTNNDAFSAIPAGLPPPTGGWDTSTAFFSSRFTKRNEFVAPAWSPDGGKIAFVSTRDPNFEIYVMDADGSNQIRLTYLPGTSVTPAWSPDGSKIAFENQYRIYVMDADGSNPTRLSDLPGTNLNPTWSPDGSKIFFENQDQTYVMDADGSNESRLPSGRGQTLPPDGSKIAYAESC